MSANGFLGVYCSHFRFVGEEYWRLLDEFPSGSGDDSQNPFSSMVTRVVVGGIKVLYGK